MNLTIVDELARLVAHTNSLQECDANELKQLSDTYPYFSAAQFLLACKQRENNDPGYALQQEKLCLYFQQPLWLEQLLEQKGNMITHTPQKVEPLIKVDMPAAGPEQDSVSPLPEIEMNQEPGINTGSKAETPENDTASLTFEPYHTVDYFASQGIRFKEEAQPTDKFGQQLKSFTEWLKTLKKLPARELVTAVDSRSEQKVEQLAENSLTEPEVLTEAMAEVWAKQGNWDKAAETYRKLSLLDPSKSSYFAAKIEQLKQS